MPQYMHVQDSSESVEGDLFETEETKLEKCCLFGSENQFMALVTKIFERRPD